MFYLYIAAHLGDGNKPVAPIKIGFSSDTVSRFSQLQLGNPREITFCWDAEFATRRGARSAERYLHEVLHKYRLRREWFDIAPERAIEVFETYLAQRVF